MTQASLSPDLSSTIGAGTPDGPRPATNSEAALWLFALTASALVLASLLLLGMLVSNPAADAALGGFMTATAVVVAVIGVGAMGYVLSSARRAGYLQHGPDIKSSPAQETASPATALDGLQVAPVVPADLARSKRRRLAQEQAQRSQQARAIATAETSKRPPARPVTPIPVVARGAGPAPVRIPAAVVRTPAPVRTQARRPAPVRIPSAVVRTPAPMRTPVRPPAQARPNIRVAQQQTVARHQPVMRQQPAAPRRPVMPWQPIARPQPDALRRPSVQAPRPAPLPHFLRMPAPVVRPRTQAALAQLAGTEIRARAMRPAGRPAVARPVAIRA